MGLKLNLILLKFSPINDSLCTIGNIVGTDSTFFDTFFSVEINAKRLKYIWKQFYGPWLSTSPWKVLPVQYHWSPLDSLVPKPTQTGLKARKTISFYFKKFKLNDSKIHSISKFTLLLILREIHPLNRLIRSDDRTMALFSRKRMVLDQSQVQIGCRVLSLSHIRYCKSTFRLHIRIPRILKPQNRYWNHGN